MSEVLAGEAAAQNPAPAPAPEAPAGQLSMEAAKPFIDAFGDIGAKWYLEGKTMSECLGLQNADLAKANGELLAKVADLEAKLAAALAASGESEALSSNPVVVIPPEKAAKVQKAEELKAKGAEPRVAKFGAALAPAVK